MNRYYSRLKPYYRVNQEIKENANNEQGPTPPAVVSPSNASSAVESEETAATKQNPNAPGFVENTIPTLPADKTLVFESRFESGNLRKVTKVGPFEYELYLKNDYGTQSFTQWYYFRIQNTRKGETYRLNIVNLMKPDSTYTKGMRPLVCSVLDSRSTNIGWHRKCQNIGYFQTNRTKRAFKN